MTKTTQKHSVEEFDFNNIVLSNPALEKIVSEYTELQVALENASDQESRLALVQKWDHFCRQLCTWYEIVDLKFSQDTSNEQYKADLKYRDELWPKITELEIAMKKSLLKAPFRKDIIANFGKYLIALWEADIMTYEPTIKDDLISESKLTAQYTELTAGAKLQFKEKIYNISEIKKFTEEQDRHLRHDSQAVMWNWFMENGGQLDSIFDELVHLRTEMAVKLGFNDYIGLAYKKMKRVDYNQADVEQYRSEVLQHVVPLAQAIREKQRDRLGLEKLYAYDEPLFVPDGNPKPKGEHDDLVERAIEMFDELGTGIGEFFRIMKNSHLLDLKSRKGKAHGGFCAYFPIHKVPYIFANFNGTKEDVEVFTHEMGHAFQAYSSRHQPLLDFQNPTYDSCEIHSMSLEFLTWPHMDKFFGEKGAEEFRQIHLAQSLLFLPYGVAIDHFQHLVYANPKATSSERHAIWKEMESLYLPGCDWHDLAYPAKGGRWQLTPHIYLNPFYYIDYTLATHCALQFLLKSKEDFEGAMTEYVTLCRRGGEASFQDLIRGAGLKSPFEKGCLAEVVNRAYEMLDRI